MKLYVLTDGDNLIIVGAENMGEALDIGESKEFKHRIAKELDTKNDVVLEVEFRGLNGNYIKL